MAAIGITKYNERANEKVPLSKKKLIGLDKLGSATMSFIFDGGKLELSCRVTSSDDKDLKKK